VIAVLVDGTVQAQAPTSWDDAQSAWRQHDDARLVGRRPHVTYYAVRAADDPDPRWTHAQPAGTAFLNVIGSRGYGDGSSRTGAEKAARAAIHRLIPTPAGRSDMQGLGGWYFTESGKTLAQGLHDLARVAQRRGWIAEADGRWFPLEAQR
jgi:hypothetical protein